jgi:predicted nucleic acid-binding protein
VSIGIVDTTVILHYFRKNPSAIAWVNSQPNPLSLSSVSWLEVMEGASSKASQSQAKLILGKFDLIYINDLDQQWAMSQIEKFQFSHHIGMNDCLIAALVYRLQQPLFTHNMKHMQALLGNLAVKPY